jgi:hypothetical protein
VQLRMTGCTLRNSPATAAKIHAGAHKSVCAWILCDQITISTELEAPSITQLKNFEQLSYNPRVQPNWLCDGVNVDGASYDQLITLGKTLFVESKNNS